MNLFQFDNIYSHNYGIKSDNKHGDPPIAKLRPVIYFDFRYHNPNVFVNTSNHAMAKSGDNNNLWKWNIYHLFTIVR